MGIMTLEITVTDERFGTETEHDLEVEIHTTPGEAAVSDCPGCDAEWEVTAVYVHAEKQDVAKYLSEDEWAAINAAVTDELESQR